MPSYDILKETRGDCLIWRVTDDSSGRLTLHYLGDTAQAGSYMDAVRMEIERRLGAYGVEQEVKVQAGRYKSGLKVIIDCSDPRRFPVPDLLYSLLEATPDAPPRGFLSIPLIKEALTGLGYPPDRPDGGLGARSERPAGYGSYARAAGGMSR